MNRQVPMLAVVGIAMVLSALPVLADEPTADDYLNFLKPVLGQWTVKIKIGDKTAEGMFSASLSPTGRCIVSHGSALLQYPAFHAIEGYDPEAKKWRWTAYSATGEQWVAHSSADAASLKGKKQATFRFETSLFKPDGKKDVLRGDILTVVAKNQWKQVFTNLTLNGEKQPDEEYVYERTQQGKGAKKPSSVPSAVRPRKGPQASYEDFVEWGSRLEGRWIWKATLIADWPGLSKKQGDVVEGTVSYRWILGKRAIEETSTLLESEGRTIHVWDAAARQIKIFHVDSAGATWVVSVGREGDKWPWVSEGSVADGRKTPGKGITTLTADGALVIEGDVTLGGKKLPKLHDVYKKAGSK